MGRYLLDSLLGILISLDILLRKLKIAYFNIFFS
jgi:hypothetical protein